MHGYSSCKVCSASARSLTRDGVSASPMRVRGSAKPSRRSAYPVHTDPVAFANMTARPEQHNMVCSRLCSLLLLFAASAQVSACVKEAQRTILDRTSFESNMLVLPCKDCRRSNSTRESSSLLVEENSLRTPTQQSKCFKSTLTATCLLKLLTMAMKWTLTTNLYLK